MDIIGRIEVRMAEKMEEKMGKRITGSETADIQPEEEPEAGIAERMERNLLACSMEQDRGKDERQKHTEKDRRLMTTLERIFQASLMTCCARWNGCWKELDL